MVQTGIDASMAEGGEVITNPNPLPTDTPEDATEDSHGNRNGNGDVKRTEEKCTVLGKGIDRGVVVVCEDKAEKEVQEGEQKKKAKGNKGAEVDGATCVLCGKEAIGPGAAGILMGDNDGVRQEPRRSSVGTVWASSNPGQFKSRM